MSATTAIVMVNYLSGNILRDRVSRYIEEGYTVVVTDNSGEYSGPGIVVRSGMNLGFGGGCNLAVLSIPKATEWVGFMNPDVTVEPGFVGRLSDYGDRSNLDCVAPSLATPQGLITQGYHQPQLMLETLHLLRRQRSPNREPGDETRSTSNIVVHAYQKLRTSGARFGSGACLLVKRQAFDSIDGFDERFALYGEDLDLWFRLDRAGSSVGFADHLVATHSRGAGSPTSRVDRTLLRWAGIELFVQIHHGPRWRFHRGLHRLGAQSMGAGASSTVKQLLTDCWTARLDPKETAAEICTAFHQGAMRPAARNLEPA